MPINQGTPEISRRGILTGLGAAAAAAAFPPLALAGATTAFAAAVSQTNPLILKRADPHIMRHTDGKYYFTASVPEYDRLVIRSASTLAGLGTATEKVLWTRSAGSMGGHIWAPELHFFDDRWYMYFAAGTSAEPFRVRPYVLQSSGPDAMTSTWSVLGRIFTAWDTFSLDATTFVHNGERYMVWAQQEAAVGPGTNLYISRMSGPATLTGPQARISVPTLAWERVGHVVNEGPAVIIRNGRVFCTYSASATDANYCMGLLTASATADLLDPASWTKSPNPVFKSSEATSQYGPGHNSFTVAEDGVSDILVYHSRDYRDINGEPLYDQNRHTRVQKLYWNADGTPNLGIPLKNGPLPVRLMSFNFPTRCVRHYLNVARLDADVTLLADSQFNLSSGLAGGTSVSLESANFPGKYLVDRGTSVRLEASDGSASFAAAASFNRRPGLASSSGTSFESVANPGRYLRHFDYKMVVQSVTAGLGYQDATFTLD